MHSPVYRFVLSLTLTVLLAGLSPGKTEAAIYSLLPTDDTYADQLAPGNNYSYLNSLITRKSVAAAQTYLKFSLEDIPATEQIVAAVFGLYSHYGYHAWVTLNHLSDDSWSERGLTWNNRPAGGTQGVELDRQYLESANNWLIWDMFGNNNWDAAADLADGYASLLVISLNSDLFFASKEFFISGQQPFLMVATVPVSTPAPQAWLLMAAGLVGILGIRKKYR